ncbi:hypothetical protein RUM43_005573, partial [Polyplax serrata]
MRFIRRSIVQFQLTGRSEFEKAEIRVGVKVRQGNIEFRWRVHQEQGNGNWTKSLIQGSRKIDLNRRLERQSWGKMSKKYVKKVLGVWKRARPWN